MLKIHEYFLRGYHRPRDPLPRRPGEIIQGKENLLAQFFMDVRHGDCIEAVSFKCSTCVVLVAYCERLAEIVKGSSLQQAEQISPQDLLLAFPEVPPYRHDRAPLAVAALHSAVRNARTNVPQGRQVSKNAT